MALVGAAVVGITSLSLAKANAIAISSMGSNKVALQAQQYASAKGELYRTMKYSELTAQAKRDIQNSNGFQDEVTVSAETDYPSDSTVKQKLCTVRVYKTGEAVPRSTLVVTRYSKSMDASGVPSGSIIPWYGNIADIPDGFALCNGINGTPDLRDKFIVGAGSTYALRATGGANSVTLTSSNIANHQHYIMNTDHVGGAYYDLSVNSDNYMTYRFGGGGMSESYNLHGSNTVPSVARTSSVIGASSVTAHENRPPYYALYYIMKV